MQGISVHTAPISIPGSLAEQEAGQATRQSLGPLNGEELSRIVENQVVVTWELHPATPEEYARLTDTRDFSEAEWAAVVSEAKKRLGAEDLKELAFDPSAWEKHTGVLIAAIIALNIARVAIAELRGHFSVMSANAAVEQGAAIREGGNAALYSALGGAVIAGSLSLAGTVMTFQGYRQKQAGLATQKKETVAALDLERDMRDNHLPHVAKGEPKIVEGIIYDAKQQRKQVALDREQDALKSDRLINLGTSVSGLAMVISNVMTSAIRLAEITQREKEVLQQSNQNVQKSLGDEEAQIDASTLALMQKIFEVMQQINESRNRVIEATSGRA